MIIDGSSAILFFYDHKRNVPEACRVFREVRRVRFVFAVAVKLRLCCF